MLDRAELMAQLESHPDFNKEEMEVELVDNPYQPEPIQMTYELHNYGHGDRWGEKAPTYHRNGPKINRNDTCPLCESGKKYKKCCMNKG